MKISQQNCYSPVEIPSSNPGNAMKGLKVHPDGSHIIYPFGTKVAIQNMETKTYRYLEGHNNVISSVAVSRTGKYIASGQINHMGFKAPVIVWDYATGQSVFKHDSHKVRVENVQFSICENYIISLGGRDDANVVVFDIISGDAICGTFSSNLNAGDAVTIGALNVHNLCFLTGGVYTLRLWTLDPKNKSVLGVDVLMGKIRRKITCIEVDKKDEFAWCGTSTGDLMKVKLNFCKEDLKNSQPISTPSLVGCFAKHSPQKKRPLQPELWVVGVRSLLMLKDDLMVVGAGDGTIQLVRQQQVKINRLDKNVSHKLIIPTYPLFVPMKTCSVGALVTSMQFLFNKKRILVGTIKCEMLIIDFETFKVDLYLTCHTQAIYSLTFPNNYSDVFATSSKDDVRIWSVSMSRELLRIRVPNFTCSSVLFAPDGRNIITGWNDGNIRAFTPQSGRLVYTIHNAHNKGVTAMAMTSDCKKLVTGGLEGEVRIWQISRNVRSLWRVLKEHKGPVSSLDVSPDDTEAVSASTDGTCIIWDIVKAARLAILFSTTLFMCVKYHPNGCQLVTTGTNRQLGYWEVFDGSLVREIEGSKSAALNTLDISKNGLYMVTGGNDQYVKLWLYKEGYATHVGLGHGGIISAVKFSCDMKTLVSCSADGAIFIWKTPIETESESLKSQEKSEPKDNVAEEKIEKISSKQSVRSESRASDGKKIETEDDKKSLKNLSRSSSKVSAKSCKQDLQSNVRADDKSSGDSLDISDGGSIKCYCTQACTCENGKMSRPPEIKNASNISDDEPVKGQGSGARR
ncbi:cilia- and flagella-associated protein 52 isoform X2 [Rhodnius prolixus]|uniref:cilia- and flagella-associated protein 52 isoform X2 n=2 Tax=Rhodnius prolixus TaxID=13249 RepID=UPI003D18EFEB